MHRQLLHDKRWLSISGFITLLVLTLLPLALIQPGMVVIGILLISSLIGVGYFVQDQ
ncbi:hypothetical protein [Streptococcus merionis]|uniref:Uncharacterized protein n=1 Tax=Streptococcus merionis TaxID=400065 RepID=A0A239STB0_9STRE|nr:hypothetical protein [Streptococcus merionis]SNU88078.1 Uncharacterised protein [Streptococcus merionis]